MKIQRTLPRILWAAKDGCVWFMNPHSSTYTEYIRKDIAEKEYEQILEFIKNIPDNLYVGLDNSGEPYLDKKELLKELKRIIEKFDEIEGKELKV